MRLIITRHGETEENLAGVLQGHLPGKLSALGIEQAKKVALRLKDEKIDFIFSSDLARAFDTAKEIAKYHPNAPLKCVKNLRERDYGEFQGKKERDFNWNVENYKVTSIQQKTVETLEELYHRAESFLHKIIPKHHQDTILFVGHNGINKALIAIITSKKKEEIQKIDNQHNTSINIFELGEDKSHKVLCLNCTKHLD